MQCERSAVQPRTQSRWRVRAAKLRRRPPCFSRRSLKVRNSPPSNAGRAYAGHVLDRTKAALLPRGSHLRRLPLGIGRGLVLEVDFAHQTKQYLGLYEIEVNKWLRRL